MTPLLDLKCEQSANMIKMNCGVFLVSGYVGLSTKLHGIDDIFHLNQGGRTRLPKFEFLANFPIGCT